MDYLVELSPTFGPYAWGFYVFQALLLVIGFYLYFLRKDGQPKRKRLLAKVGLILLAMGSIGTLFGVLRMQNIGGFAHRYWFYLLLLVDILIGIGLVWYLRRGFAELARSSSSASKPRPLPASRTSPSSSPRITSTARGQLESVGDASPQRSRREARRERKRKQR